MLGGEGEVRGEGVVLESYIQGDCLPSKPWIYINAKTQLVWLFKKKKEGRVKRLPGVLAQWECICCVEIGG